MQYWLKTWVEIDLTQFFWRFLTKVSVSSLVFRGYRPFETLCISSLWSEKSKQEPKIAWIWPYTSFNSCEHQQFVFSDLHWALLLTPCWLQCCWKTNVNFCKWENSVKVIGYPKLSKFSILLFMLKMKLYVCRNLCENFRQIGQKMKKL